jgi:hypothetical protein
MATSQSERGTADEPGVHSLDPAAGTSTILVPLATEQVSPWRFHR